MTDRAATPWDEPFGQLILLFVSKGEDGDTARDSAQRVYEVFQRAGYSLAGPDQLVVPRTPAALDTLVEAGVAELREWLAPRGVVKGVRTGGGVIKSANISTPT